jgi:hypothetical protein
MWFFLPAEPDASIPIVGAADLEYSDDGSRLFIAARAPWEDQREQPQMQVLTIWDCQRGRICTQITERPGQRAWTRDGKHLLVLHYDRLRMYDAEAGQLVKEVEIATQPLHDFSTTGLSEETKSLLGSMAERGVRTYATSLQTISNDLVAVICSLGMQHEQMDWRHLIGASHCERRYRLPDLTPSGAELFVHLQPEQRGGATAPLVAVDRSNRDQLVQGDDTYRGWRLLDPKSLRTKLWIAEAHTRPRVAALNDDGSVLATAAAYSPSPDEWRQAAPSNWSVRLYDAGTGGELATFANEFTVQFSRNRQCFLTQSDYEPSYFGPTKVHVRDFRTGQLLATRELVPRSLLPPDPVSSTSKKRDPNEPSTHALTWGAHRFGTSDHPDIPFVGIEMVGGGRRSWLGRCRRIEHEYVLTDVVSGRELARLSGVDALSPRLDFAVQNRGYDVALWRLKGGIRPPSWRRLGLALAIAVGVLLLNVAWRHTLRVSDVGDSDELLSHS